MQRIRWDTVKVSIYYEALCGDSIRFIAQQLHPNFPKLADYIDLDLVPYGKAVHSNIHGTYYFSCQHGPAECKGNVYQSCALSQNQGDRKNVEFVNCIMRRNPDHFVNVEKCARKHEFNIGKIRNCSRGVEGSELLAQNGEKTLQLEPVLSFVPTIIYNDVYSNQDHMQSLKDFAAVVCSKIEGDKPEICANKRLPRTSWGFFEIF
ncbi:unnamed protein product [Acanthoscelides obtectus]|uniref:Gamma-interferon-inducible lysosomal thiol reductase n=1 Tax=Acanthoscelides obtectus TaxID=200917 RepID=A0A9P0P4F3_ACAOB|nr:unnamed protein product [Acanthoscelides obtectus]CAK1633471.1 GILT-like protein 1 [Acanthoscelides obtectus]